jgi:F0F1-type ATP synthase assembly protein I
MSGRQMGASLRLAAAGMTLAFCVVIGAGFGYWLDGRFKTTWWTPLFAVLGVIAGFRELILAVNAANRADDEERARKRGSRDAGDDD